MLHPSRLVGAVFAARRRLSGLRLDELRTGRFRMPALVGGPPTQRVPVVMVHGFTDTKDSFVDTARLLTPTHRVILPDLPGFSGASQPLDHCYSVHSTAALLAEALHERAPEGIHLVGNSLGGAVAACMALERGAWVRSLTLIGALGVRMPRPSALQHHMQAGLSPFGLRGEEDYAGFLRFVLERVPPMPGFVVRQMARAQLARGAMNDKIMADLLDEGLDLTARLPEIKVPTMVLWGDCDRLIDLSAGRVFHQGIADAKLVVLSGIGHCPQVEAPRATARRIRDTVARAQPEA
ncbi:MAG: alpha/beta fold hydrolase [Deltaproteobacteria bacterium]|nr:alpha/beta fold hydrolase [Deltaproteobacteria bacterium]